MPRKSPRRSRSKRSAKTKRGNSRRQSRLQRKRSVSYRAVTDPEGKIQKLAESLSRDPRKDDFKYRGYGNKAFICIPNHHNIRDAYHVTEAIRTKNPFARKLKEQRPEFQEHWLAFDAGGLAMVKGDDVQEDVPPQQFKKSLTATIRYGDFQDTLEEVIRAWNAVPNNPFNTSIRSDYNDHIFRFLHSVKDKMKPNYEIVVCYEDVTWQRMFCFPATYVIDTYGFYITRNPYQEYGPENKSKTKGLFFKMNMDANGNAIKGPKGFAVVPNYSIANLQQNEKIL